MVDPGIDKIVCVIGSDDALCFLQAKYRNNSFVPFGCLRGCAEVRHKLALLGRCDELWVSEEEVPENLLAAVSYCHQYDIPVRSFRPVRANEAPG